MGVRLRTIRLQWQLSLREVEERSLRIARERGNQSYQVSASWLDRLEREEHELTVNKLIVLAGIYNLHPEHLLRSLYPGDTQPQFLRQLSSTNATMLLTEGPLEEQARYLLQDARGPDQPPDETTLLSTETGAVQAGYPWQARPHLGSYDPAGLHCSDRYPETRYLVAERLDA